MTHKDRFYATINYQPLDRPDSWLRLPVPAAEPALQKHFSIRSMDELKKQIDDDIYPIEVPYNYPPSNHIACAFEFKKTNPEMFKVVIDRITDFYLKANEIFYEATKGYLDAILIGNDFGSQTGLMLEPTLIQELVWPGTKQLIDQAKSYGLTVMHHSYGSVFPLIDDLKNLGADIIHPIQALAADMDAKNLKKHFDKKIAFCGGVDAQYLIVYGTADDVTKKVRELRELFPTGLMLAIVAGVLSGVFNVSLEAGQPIADLAAQHGAGHFEGNAKLVVSTSGCLLVNLIWFIVLGIKEGTLKEFSAKSGISGSGIAKNYVWSALAGTLWCIQFFTTDWDM